MAKVLSVVFLVCLMTATLLSGHLYCILAVCVGGGGGCCACARAPCPVLMGAAASELCVGCITLALVFLAHERFPLLRL